MVLSYISENRCYKNHSLRITIHIIEKISFWAYSSFLRCQPPRYCLYKREIGHIGRFQDSSHLLKGGCARIITVYTQLPTIKAIMRGGWKPEIRLWAQNRFNCRWLSYWKRAICPKQNCISPTVGTTGILPIHFGKYPYLQFLVLHILGSIRIYYS